MGGGVAGAGQMLQVRYRTGGREEPLDGAVTEEGVGGELEDGGAGWKYIGKRVLESWPAYQESGRSLNWIVEEFSRNWPSD